MTKSTDRERPKLSFEQANAVCGAFLPLGDALFAIMAKLRAAGFKAWVPYYEFMESLAENAEERSIRQQCIVEVAKNRLGQPWPYRLDAEQRSQVFFSPYIKRLREERDALNGVPEKDLSSKYPGEIWRGAVDPCERRNVYLRVKRKEDYQGRWAAMLDEQRHRLEEEVTVHATDLNRAHTFDKDGRYALFAAVMVRDAGPLGFHYDNAKSRTNYPVFSKPIGAAWDLCWSIEDGQDFFWSPFEGLFVPRLTIRSRKLRGSLSRAELGEFLEIRYQHIVPGFGNAYWKFFGLDELETMIKAHLCFYSLKAPIIEPRLQRVLGRK
jgi:hypothetical protein